MESPAVPRKPYPTDVSDAEWAFVAPYLTLMTSEAPQRRHDLRKDFNALRWIVRAGSPWRLLSTRFPPWPAVYQQNRCSLGAKVFEAMAHDLHMLLREATIRMPQPRAVILDSRTVPSIPESGARADYNGHKQRKGAKTHAAVDTLGHLLALFVTPANAQEREQVAALAAAVQAATGESVELAYVDQGYTGEQPAANAAEAGIHLEVIKLSHAKRGFALLRLGGPLPRPGAGLRAVAGHRGGSPFPGIRRLAAPSPHPALGRESMTGSSRSPHSLLALPDPRDASCGACPPSTARTPAPRPQRDAPRRRPSPGTRPRCAGGPITRRVLVVWSPLRFVSTGDRSARRPAADPRPSHPPPPLAPTDRYAWRRTTATSRP